MAQRTFVISMDLGTSTTTAGHALVLDSLGADGKQRREKYRSACDVRDWPGAHHGNTAGDHCVPTELVYDKALRQLLFWGFEAQRYLNDPIPTIDPRGVFVVEHIKLLLLDPDEARLPTIVSERYRKKRKELMEVLGKNPYEVFDDLMTKLIGHVIESANRRYGNCMHGLKLELVLAFPSGWNDSIHSRVARIGARAMDVAISTNRLQNIIFDIENVYTVSETLVGVKEWLRDNVAESTISIDLEQQLINLDELKEGDRLLAVDMGVGTACMTPIELVTKSPLRVDQLDQTISLAASGEAVDAVFENWLQRQITEEDFPGDFTRLINQICRKFKNEKTCCGIPIKPHCLTWNVPASGLRPNSSKGFEMDCMRIDRKFLDKCFDPIFDILESAIHDLLRKVPGIKAIVFLGQFGGGSQYLRNHMEKSSVSKLVKLWHSESGKLNVVRGAMSERLDLTSSFARKWATVKSFGTLISLFYHPGSKAAKLFPNPQESGAVPFERDSEGIWLKVVQWIIPKGTTVEKGHTCSMDEMLYHTWPIHETVIKFEDVIVISDETPPDPLPNGVSYTLWTEAHENNQLTVNNKILYVQQIPFSWDLPMSQKIDSFGNFIGPYQIEDIESYKYPEKKRKGRRREWLRRIYYDLVWDITEMQVKVHVRALFPGQTGPRTTQLAKERRFEENERAVSGESRSRALIKDIEITTAVALGNTTASASASEDETRADMLLQLPTVARSALQFTSQKDSARGLPQNISRPTQSSTNSLSSDGGCREGCYTCKERKNKCDCEYIFDQKTGSSTCKQCVRLKLVCCMTQDMAQQNAKQIEPKSRVKLGKRKARDESDFQSTTGRVRSTTATPLTMHDGSHET